MAREWYLLNKSHDVVSGFESEDFDSTAQDAFAESLMTSIADDIEVFTSDLSQSTKTRAIVQGNVQDTKLNSMQRRILTQIGTCKAGMYVKYKDRFWLIVGLVDDNKIYEKSILVLCNYLLTWKNASGKIVQRWVNAASASQYNNGETNSTYYTSRTDQLMVLTPKDEECLLLPHKHRFVIDGRCKIYEKGFGENVSVDTSKSLITYELTRIDNVLYDYQDSGHSEFMAYQDEQHKADGYYVIDGKGYWLCDNENVVEEETENKNPILSCEIECDTHEILNGIEPTVFTAKFFDANGKEVTDIEPTWSINCDFVDQLDVQYVDKSVMISADNNKLINNSFELSLSCDGYETSTIVVTIVAFI